MTVGSRVRGGPPRGWSGPERRLWTAVRNGDWLDLGGRLAGRTATADTSDWGAERTLSATAIRTLLTSNIGPEGERRVRIRGARITGELLLRGVTSGTALLLCDCVLEGRLDFSGAELAELAVISSRVPELRLGWLTTASSLRLTDTTIAGPLYLTEARIGRRLTLFGTSATQVLAVGLRVGGDLDAPGLRAGRTDLTGARIEGRLRLIDTELGDGTLAVRAAGASCGGDADLTGLRAHGVVDLRTADIGGQVVLNRCALRGFGEPARPEEEQFGPVALLGEGMSTRGDFSLRDAEVGGEVRLTAARIGGTLVLNRSTLRNPGGRAFQADRATVGSGFFARHGFRAEGSVVMRDARIEGPVILSGGRIDAAGQVAFNASGITTAGGFFARDEFRCTGELHLSSAQIGGPVDLATARLDAGPEREAALRAIGMVVDGNIRARRMRVTGELDLSTARISGHLLMTASRFSDGTHCAGRLRLPAAQINGNADLQDVRFDDYLDLRETSVTGRIRLAGAHLTGRGGRSLRANGLRAGQLRLQLAERPAGRVVLTNATVDVLADTETSWPLPPVGGDSGTANLNGFRYGRLDSRLPVRDRLAWLETANPTFEPQPYEQLAACYRQAGLEREARRVLREKMRRLHRSAGPLNRVWGWVQQAAVGYGYQPGRAVAWFAGVLALGSLWFARARCARTGGEGLCPVRADEHPAWDPVLYALDLLVPVVDIGHDRAWDPLGWDKVVALTLIAMGWVLATTVLAAAGRTLGRE